MPGVPSAEFDRADVAHHATRKPVPGRARSRSASPRGRCRRGTSTPASACSRFKNDMSLSDEQIDTIVRWVDGGALQGDPKDLPAPKPLVTDNEWQGVRDGFGPPDLVIKSSEYTMPAQAPGRLVPPDERHPDHRAALGEDGRDSSDEPEGPQDRAPLDRVPRAQSTIRTRSTPAPRAAGARPSSRDDLVNRRPQIMEWAIGKGYDLFRDGTGKLIMPGEKISWDQHIHAVGEEITAGSEIGHLVLSERPGAEEAQLPDRLHRHRPARDARHPAELDRAHRRVHRAEGEHAHHQLPAALPSARQGDEGRSDPAGRRHRRSSATSTSSTSTG